MINDYTKSSSRMCLFLVSHLLRCSSDLQYILLYRLLLVQDFLYTHTKALTKNEAYVLLAYITIQPIV
jgi:hypothetical protein